MNPTDGDRDGNARRSFLLSSGGWLTGAWIAAHWPAIADAAHHAAEASSASARQGFEFLSAPDAADVDAIAAQIVPSGVTPGAREAHAVHFIDRAMATFLSEWAVGFRAGLTEFQSAFRASNPAHSFANTASDAQIAYLETIDKTAFFDTVRTLTVLGMFCASKYGGNFQGSGWRMMGFVDQHAFTPPFGHYDREYAGFVANSTERSA